MFFFDKKHSVISKRLPKVRGTLEFNVPLAKKTWLGVGGPAEVLFTPKDVDDLAYFLKERPTDVPLTVLSGCSNVLIRDGGIPGITIMIGRSFSFARTDDGTVTVGAGMRNPEFTRWALDNERTGCEFMAGIPGSIGGGVRMNAGSYGSEVRDILVCAEALDYMGDLHTVACDELHMSYRSSVFPDDWIIVSATFKLAKGDKDDIASKLAEFKKKREASQPVGVKTAGSTFKNVAGVPAWQLIDKAGCRGMTLGGAQISEKHANFMINLGHATAADFEGLGEQVRARVLKICGLHLEWEVKRIGVA